MDALYEYGPTTRLVGRYCDAVARFDLEIFASIWAENAIWYISSGPLNRPLSLFGASLS